VTEEGWLLRPLVSVVIPTRDAGPQFEQTLKAIAAQAGRLAHEVIVVDSGSRDGTLDLSRRYGARIVRIPPESFNHGRARNEGVRWARGQFVILLVQDAVPADEHWMSALVGALRSDPRVAGAYSRHLGRPDSDYLSRYVAEYWHSHVGGRRVQEISDLARFRALPCSLQRDYCTFNNVSSIIRRSVWEAHPFPPIAYAEDIAWAKAVLEAGYKLVYEPASRVVHAHERPVAYELRRAYVDARSVASIFPLPDEPLTVEEAQSLLRRLERECDLARQDLKQAKGGEGMTAAVDIFCQREAWYGRLFDNLALRQLFGPASPWQDEDRYYLYAGLDYREERALAAAAACATEAAGEEGNPMPVELVTEAAEEKEHPVPGQPLMTEAKEAPLEGDPSEAAIGAAELPISQRIAAALDGEDLSPADLQFVFHALWHELGRDYARQAVLDSLPVRSMDPIDAVEREQHAFADALLLRAQEAGALTRRLYIRVRLYALAWAVGRRLGQASCSAQAARDEAFWQDLTQRWAPGI